MLSYSLGSTSDRQQNCHHQSQLCRVHFQRNLLVRQSGTIFNEIIIYIRVLFCIASISFSIKPKDTDHPITFRPALPQEPSSDEEDSAIKPESITAGAASSEIRPLPQLSTHPTPMSTITAANRIIVLETIELPTLQLNGIGCTFASATTPTTVATKINDERTVIKSSVSNDSATPPATDLSEVSLRDSMLEGSSSSSSSASSTVICQEKRDAKRAEEKFKDRMAQVARDKLGSITREKQLQLERRKKAMAFLNQIKSNVFLHFVLSFQLILNPHAIVFFRWCSADRTRKVSECQCTKG